MVKVGQKVRFDPFAHICGDGIEDLRYEITGRIAYINWAHKWFSVVYGNRLRTSFHFFDVGKEVTICGRG